MSSNILDHLDISLAKPTGKAIHPRILYVVSTRHAGGLEVACVRLASLLMRTQPGAQTIIVACRRGQYVEQCCRDEGLPTTPLLLRNSGDISAILRLAHIIRSEKIDIVHAHSRRDYVAAGLAVALVRRETKSALPRLVLHHHLVRTLGNPAWLSGLFFKPLVDRYIAVSEVVRAYLLANHAPIDPARVTVIPNGIDFENFQRDLTSRAMIRHEYELPASAIVMGMVGRLDTKGQKLAIEALSRLGRPNVHLMLVGTSPSEKYIRLLHTTARERGVYGRVIFCGAQSDIAAYLSAMDLLIHLPIDEAFGLAPAEAMSSGLPVIVSDRGGCVELVQDGFDGIVVDPESEEAVAGAMSALIDSPMKRQALGIAAWKSVRDRFSVSVQAQAMTAVYSQLLQETEHGQEIS